MRQPARAPGFEIRPGGAPIGAEILGLDLAREIDDVVFAEIAASFNRHGVIVFRDQRLTPEQQIAFSRRFGPLQVNVRSEFNKPGHPEIFIVSNVEIDGKPIGSRDAGRYWHSDLCYLPQPSKASLLYALEVPTQADGTVLGDTLFASAGAAYESLAAPLQQRLAGLRAANGYTYMYERKVQDFALRPALSDAERAGKYPRDAIHPVIRTHPATGRKCLYVCEGYTHRIVDLPEDESRALLDRLFAHIAAPQHVYRHKWRVGDLLMWDNCAVQHKVSFDYAPPLRRRLERCTVEGSAPY
jgi:taurine dioxygenase